MPARQPPRFKETVIDTHVRSQTEHRVERLSQLYRAQSLINDAVARATDFTRLCEQVCRIGVEVGGIACVLVRLYDEKSDMLLPVAFHGPDAGLAGRRELPADDSKGVSALAFSTGEPVIVDDLLGSPFTRHVASEIAARLNINSAAAFPLLADGHPIGTFAMFAAGTGFFDADMSTLLAQTAALLAFSHGKLTADASRTEIERRHRELVERSPTAIRVIQDGRIVMINRAGLDQTGYASFEEIGESALSDFIHPDQRQLVATLVADLTAGKGDGYTQEYLSRHRDGHYYPVEVTARPFEFEGRPAVIGYVVDLTARKAYEQRIVRLAALNASLSKINNAVARVTDFDSLASAACKIAVEEGGFISAIIRVVDADMQELVQIADFGARDGFLGRSNIRVDDTQGTTTRAFHSKQPVLIRDLATDPITRHAADDGRRLGIRSGAAFPLITDGVAFGTMTVWARDTSYVADENLNLLQQMADSVAFARSKLKADAALVERERDLILAQRAARVGSVIINLKTGHWTTTAVGCGILGFDGVAWRPLSAFEQMLEPSTRAATLASMRANIASGKPSSQDYDVLLPSDGKRRWIRVVTDTEFAPDGAALRRIGTLQDVTEEIESKGRIERLSHLYGALSKTNEAVVRIDHYQDLAQKICQIVVDEGRLVSAAIRLYRAESQALVEVASHGPRTGSLGRPAVPVNDSQGVAVHAFRHGSRIVVTNLEEHPSTRHSLDDFRAHGIVSVAAFPLRVDGAPIGTMTLFGNRPEVFDDQMCTLIEEIANSAAFAYAKLANQRTLAETERRYRSLVEASLNSIMLLDGETIQYANPATATMLGCDDIAEVIGSSALALTIPEHQANTRANIARMMGSPDETLDRKLLKLRHRDGRIVDTYATAASINFDGRTLIQLELRDVTRERKALADAKMLAETLEARVEDRTRELSLSNLGLEAANRDLESFSYSVAHDLRAPLRSIVGFSSLLDEDLAGGQFEEVASHAKRISASALRMNDLIDGLLAVARVTHGALADAPVDFDAMAHAAARESKPDAAARITIDPLPAVRGDAASLRQVWANLISNAVKYSAKRSQPQIGVGCKTSPTEVVFYVSDNGAGFAQAHVNKLFGVFQRLHTTEEFEGTGVGLTVVRRIVERHGGRVWAEGAPDAGATFYFSLPVARLVTPAAG